MTSGAYLDNVDYPPHAALACLAVLAGIQDWRSREVSDWLTWPLFFFGQISAIVNAVKHLDYLPLTIMIFLIVTWYFSWMGGADMRIFIGLWGFWPAGGPNSLGCHRPVGLGPDIAKTRKGKLPGAGCCCICPSDSLYH